MWQFNQGFAKKKIKKNGSTETKIDIKNIDNRSEKMREYDKSVLVEAKVVDILFEKDKIINLTLKTQCGDEVVLSAYVDEDNEKAYLDYGKDK
jgi:hypothetical protein